LQSGVATVARGWDFGPAPRSYNHAIACVLKHPNNV
jgi:hypothetical protein